MAFNIDIWDEVVKWLHKNGKFTPDMLTDEPARNLIGETNRILSDAVQLSITEEVPAELTAQLEQNTYVFSAFKGFHNLKEASLKLTNSKGGIKPFETFKQDVLKVHKTYNVRYLEAEYNFAVQSAQMAVKWADYAADSDRYNLQYRTADDSKVRAEHAALHGVTLPVDDPFWDKYFPPLGWNCRCTAVQVRKDKYPVSDSATAMRAGDKATSGNKQQIFRFNPGKEGKIFPPKHPYLPKGCEGCKKNNIRLAFSNANEKCSSCAYAQKNLQWEQNKKEYERLKNDPDYVDVEFDPITGALKASHIGHINHTNYKEERFLHNLSPDGKGYSSTELELFCQNNLFKLGHKAILRNESIIKNGDTLPALDLELDNKIMDIASITTSKNFGGILTKKNKQLGRFKRETGIDSDSLCLYFHDPNSFSISKLENDIEWYKRFLIKQNVTQRIKYLYVVINNSDKLIKLEL